MLFHSYFERQRLFQTGRLLLHDPFSQLMSSKQCEIIFRISYDIVGQHSSDAILERSRSMIFEYVPRARELDILERLRRLLSYAAPTEQHVPRATARVVRCSRIPLERATRMARICREPGARPPQTMI